MRLNVVQQLTTNSSFATVWLFGAGGLGLACVFAGIYLYLDARQFKQVARRTEGRIVDTRLETSPRTSYGSSSSYLVVEFQLEAQQTIRFRSVVGTLGNARRIGQTVGVLYDPSNPQRAKIDAFWELQGPYVIFLGAGLIFVLAALMMAIIL